MTRQDMQSKRATTPGMQRLFLVERVRAALREVEQSTIGSAQEGLAIDAVRMAADRLADLYQDAFPGTPAGEREPVAPRTDSWSEG